MPNDKPSVLAVVFQPKEKCTYPAKAVLLEPQALALEPVGRACACLDQRSVRKSEVFFDLTLPSVDAMADEDVRHVLTQLIVEAPHFFKMKSASVRFGLRTRTLWGAPAEAKHTRIRPKRLTDTIEY